MATGMELYEENLDRILKTVRFEKTDRTPVVPLADSFCAKQQGLDLTMFTNDPVRVNEIMIKSFTELGDVDGIQNATFSAHVLGNIWFSKVKMPGVELPPDELWQVDEQELMTIEDYDAIVEMGFRAWREKFYLEKLGDLNARTIPFIQAFPGSLQNMKEHGIVPFSPAVFTIPYEMFCGGRTMVKFLKDLFRIPDKVQAAMDAAMPVLLEDAMGLLYVIKLTAVWVGGWRAASEFISPKYWQRFVFPYYQKIVEAVVEQGVIPVLHFDSNWTRDLEFLRQLPAKKCIFSPDGQTDIFKAKEILDGHMAIMGDVHAAMLALGTPEQVTEYCKGLIEKIGPTGYIMAQGCDIPPDAKPENVAALIASVH